MTDTICKCYFPNQNSLYGDRFLKEQRETNPQHIDPLLTQGSKYLEEEGPYPGQFHATQCPPG